MSPTVATMLRARLVVSSPVGAVHAGWTPEGLAFLHFLGATEGTAPEVGADGSTPSAVWSDDDLIARLRRELGDYAAGRLGEFSIPLAPVGTPFQRQVWDALRSIPAGQARSYAHVARLIGRPSAVRAVARANATNPIAILIPCHRVIGSDGTLTGYAGGLDRKRCLLDHEARHWGKVAAGGLFGV